jgi:hydrogenase expression/formation protein HypD
MARRAKEPVLFFATGFETTAVATAAVLLADPPPNLFVLSAHKWVPAAMDAVALAPGGRIEGYLAAGHAATITGWGIFEAFAAKYAKPVVVAGFEPLDILSALVLLVEHVAAGEAEVVNAFPRCVSREGNRRAMEALFRVFETSSGEWRGIARLASGNLALRPEFARHDATVHFAADIAAAGLLGERASATECLCGAIMTGQASPTDCGHFGQGCTPDAPVGACMVSTEGVCRIWFEHAMTDERAAPGSAP